LTISELKLTQNDKINDLYILEKLSLVKKYIDFQINCWEEFL